MDELDQMSPAEADTIATEAELEDAGAQRDESGELQMQLAMHQLVVQGNVRVVKNDQTGERALVVGPILLNLVLPFTQETAHMVARELTGGVVVASALPQGGLQVVKR